MGRGRGEEGWGREGEIEAGRARRGGNGERGGEGGRRGQKLKAETPVEPVWEEKYTQPVCGRKRE